MTETENPKEIIKVKRFYGPNIGDVFFSWFFYGLFRMAFYRFLFPWSFLGIALNYILLFSAISLTFRAIFSPRRHIYSVYAEMAPEEPSTTHSTPHETQKTSPNEPTNTETQDREKQVITPITPIAKSEVEIIDQPSNQSGQIRYCSFCGVENITQANFCHACGERLR